MIGTIWYVYRNYFKKIDTEQSAIIHTEIKKLISNAYDFDGKKVKVVGIVTDSYNLGLVKFYRIKDESKESIWVNTDFACPAIDIQVKVTGKFKQLYKVGDKEMPVIIEMEKAKVTNNNRAI